MADFTGSYEVLINAPVHEVFEYCRDPRHLFEGWSGLKVTEVVATPPEGVGTRFRVEAKFTKAVVEKVDREFTEFVPDERIVSKAHVQIRFAGRTKDDPNGPILTWLFVPEDGGTKLTFVILEEHLSRWQYLGESVIAAMGYEKRMRQVLAAIKAGVERPVPPVV